MATRRDLFGLVAGAAASTVVAKVPAKAAPLSHARAGFVSLKDVVERDGGSFEAVLAERERELTAMAKAQIGTLFPGQKINFAKAGR